MTTYHPIEMSDEDRKCEKIFRELMEYIHGYKPPMYVHHSNIPDAGTRVDPLDFFRSPTSTEDDRPTNQKSPCVKSD